MAGGALGRQLASAARLAFIDGMHSSLLVGAIVVAFSVLLVLIALPARAAQTRNSARPEDPPVPQTPPASPLDGDPGAGGITGQSGRLTTEAGVVAKR